MPENANIPLKLAWLFGYRWRFGIGRSRGAGGGGPPPAPPTNWGQWTIGTDGGTLFGYQAGSFGALTQAADLNGLWCDTATGHFTMTTLSGVELPGITSYELILEGQTTRMLLEWDGGAYVSVDPWFGEANRIAALVTDTIIAGPMQERTLANQFAFWPGGLGTGGTTWWGYRPSDPNDFEGNDMAPSQVTDRDLRYLMIVEASNLLRFKFDDGSRPGDYYTLGFPDIAYSGDILWDVAGDDFQLPFQAVLKDHFKANLGVPLTMTLVRVPFPAANGSFSSAFSRSFDGGV